MQIVGLYKYNNVPLLLLLVGFDSETCTCMLMALWQDYLATQPQGSILLSSDVGSLLQCMQHNHSMPHSHFLAHPRQAADTHRSLQLSWQSKVLSDNLQQPAVRYITLKAPGHNMKR